MKEKIIVVGGGGHAKVVISILKRIENFEPIGYTDIQNKGDILGIPYLGNDEKLFEIFGSGIKYATIGVGQIKSALTRREIFSSLKQIGFHIPAIIAISAVVNQDVEIGHGTVLMDGVIVNSGTIIGELSIINTKASIDHDCNIGSFTHIAPGVTLSGNVKIGENVLVGTGANVIQGISITDNVLISAGSSVQRNITIEGIYRGVPARLIKAVKDETHINNC